MGGRRSELALVSVYELYTINVKDALDAGLLPRRGVQRVLVEEIPSSISLLLIQAGHEVEV